jgi:ATP-binding cassette, subfamily A (ABC1), member 3
LPSIDIAGITLNDCFPSIQNSIENLFLSMQRISKNPATKLYSFFYIPSPGEAFYEIFKAMFPALIIFSSIYAINKIVKNVAMERESRLKEMMKIMGLSKFVHWLSWFTSSMINLLISFTVISFIFCFKIIKDTAIFEHSNVLLIWIFLFIYISGIVTFGFLISAIFKKAKTAGTLGSIVFLLTYIPYYQFQSKFIGLNYILKFLFCIPINSGLGQGISIIYFTEIQKTGLQFSNLFSRDNNGNFAIAEVWLAMIFSSVIHVLLTSYLEQVFPGDIGVAKKWYFPFEGVTKFMKRNSGHFIINQDKLNNDKDDFEADPNNLEVGIKIDELTKVFGNSTAVNQLSLNMYKGQITVLLGHNGCGKSTTMNMLTGMFSPTSGTAYLDGHDITTDTIEARKSLGLCPQHNVLIDELTVKEHLIFFSRLKGIEDEGQILNQVNKYLDLLDFRDKANVLTKTLSGGQQRKLSIGIALCGDSKIVMLDEPTAGLDTGARRLLWNLLLEEKKQRTIMLTTHHMDEADVLGDRIAIMSEGELQTIGSSYFLKKRFGSGYKLICVKKPECDSSAILKELHNFAPDVTIESENQSEVIFIISEDHVPNFKNIFSNIEEKSEKLNISSFGCSMTSLEEVFIKIGAGNNKTEFERSSVVTFNDLSTSEKVEGNLATFYQIQAIIMKHFLLGVFRNLYSIGWLTLFTILLTYITLKAPVSSDSYTNDKTPSVISYSYFENEETVTTLERRSNYLHDLEIAESLMKDFTIVATTRDKWSDYLGIRYRTSFADTYKSYLTAFSWNDSYSNGYYVSKGQDDHLLQSLLISTINRVKLKKAKGSEYDIQANYKKLPYSEPDFLVKPSTETAKENEVPDNAYISNFVSIYFLFFTLMVYWPQIFISAKVKERISRSKLLQFISGTNRFTFWLTSYAIDFIILFLIGAAIVSSVAISGRVNFRSSKDVITYIVIMFFYSFSYVPFIYVFSFLFKKPATSESMVFVVGLVSKFNNRELKLIMYIILTLYNFHRFSFIWNFRYN